MDGPIFYFAAPSGHAPSGYSYIMHIHTYICGTYDSRERDGANAHAKVSIESNVLRCREILGACRENHALWQALVHERVLFERKMKYIYITYRSRSIYYKRSREQLATLGNLSLSMIRGRDISFHKIGEQFCARVCTFSAAGLRIGVSTLMSSSDNFDTL